MNLSRRGALQALAGAGAAAALGSAYAPRALAAPSPDVATSSVQGAGFYRANIGSLEITVVSDGMRSFTPYPLFGANAGKEYVEQALQDAYLPTDRVDLQINTLLIRSGRDLVLVDTGCGGLSGPNAGHLVRNLRRAGVSPGDVTHVLLTHLHRDHVGGALDSSGRLAFPSARIFVHRAERDFWVVPEPDLARSGVPPEIKRATVSAAHRFLGVLKDDLILLDDPNTQIVDGVVAMLAAGHTPGHLTVSVASGGDRLIYLADLVHHHAIILPHPTWHVGLDTDPDRGVKARQDWLSRFVTDRALVGGAHLPFPSLGHLRQMNGGAAWVPLEWHW